MLRLSHSHLFLHPKTWRRVLICSELGSSVAPCSENEKTPQKQLFENAMLQAAVDIHDAIVNHAALHEDRVMHNLAPAI